VKYRRAYKLLSAAAAVTTLASTLGSTAFWLMGFGSFYGVMAVVWFAAFLWSVRELREAFRSGG
jgi:hypothetical protein